MFRGWKITRAFNEAVDVLRAASPNTQIYCTHHDGFVGPLFGSYIWIKDNTGTRELAHYNPDSRGLSAKDQQAAEILAAALVKRGLF